jgi:hypothetical protein
MGRLIGYLTACALLLPATLAAAQQNATLQGSVVDESDAVVPGITVVAIDNGTGVETEAVADVEGRYRFSNLAPGRYLLRLALSGFATVEIKDVDLLVGQNVTVPRVVMKVAALGEALTVRAESPLVDTTSARVAGNIDRRQMAELPLQGRNWQELSLMVKGVTANNITNTPGANDGQFQLNLDGQQITQRVAGSGFGQPKVSREAIAEFQIVTNMFDITQGRSTGMQVQAISRAGTNTLRGSAYGFFRDDSFNAADPVSGTVLPFQNQQTGATLGGPILLNKLHYFGSFEYERQPANAFLSPTQLPNQRWSLSSKDINRNYLGRMDYQIDPNDSLTVRLQRWTTDNPFAISSGGSHPSTAEVTRSVAQNIVGTWTHVVGNNMTLQVNGGVNEFAWFLDSIPEMDVAFHNTPFFVPQFSFPSLTIGGRYNYPNYTWQDTYSGRTELTWLRGHHDLKAGGEFLRVRDTKIWNLDRRGTYRFSRTPPVEELERRFPADAWNNPAAWDISGLEPYLQQFTINFNPDYLVDTPRPTLAVWLGDTWHASNQLTVSMGVRYDADWGASNPPWVTETEILINNGVDAGDFGYKNDIRDLKNVAPRVGVSYNVGGANNLVIRGGSGLYYATPVSNATYSHQYYNRSVAAAFLPDGQPGFMEDPTRGASAEDFLEGRVPVPIQTAYPFDHNFKNPFAWQSSIGFQKQLGPVTGVDLDLTVVKEYRMTRSRDVNLFFDPITGYNLDPARYGRPNPAYSEVKMMNSEGEAENILLSSSFTRRFAGRLQGSIVYTRGISKKDNTTGFGYYANNQFDPDADWGNASDFQRDTLRGNVIVDLPFQMTVASSFFYGSGNYFNASSSLRPYNKPGNNRLNTGAPIVIPAAMLDRWDGPDVIATGTEWPRNALRGLPIKKVDVRFTKRFQLVGSARVELLAEVFNLFNAKNYGAYNTVITSPSFGTPQASSGNAYVSRQGQLGVRVDF